MTIIPARSASHVGVGDQEHGFAALGQSAGEAAMSRVLLIIGGEPPFAAETAAGPPLPAEESLRYETAAWASFRFDSLPSCGADLVVPMAVPQTEPALSFFQWLSAHPVATPTLAV